MSKINDIFQKELQERREQNIFSAQKEQDPKTIRISIDETNEEAFLEEDYKPQQVKSLLNLVLDPLDRKNIADAEDDALATHHLNQLNRHKIGR